MATPRAPDSYPDTYGEFFLRAAQESLTIKYPTQLDAQRQRARLHAFRRALLDYPDWNLEVALLAPIVRLRIVETSIVTEVIKDDLTPIRKALENADQLSAGTGPARASLSSSDRLDDAVDRSLSGEVSPRVRRA